MKQVSYPYFVAFISLLNSMELVKQIYSSATKDDLDMELTKGRRLLLLPNALASLCTNAHP